MTVSGSVECERKKNEEMWNGNAGARAGIETGLTNVKMKECYFIQMPKSEG